MAKKQKNAVEEQEVTFDPNNEQNMAPPWDQEADTEDNEEVSTSTAAKPKSLSKAEINSRLSSMTGLSRKQVAEVFGALEHLIKEQLLDDDRGVFKTSDGLLQLNRTLVPAREGGTKPNPFKPGEMMEVKPRDAHYVVKVKPLKKLRDLLV